MIIPMDEKSCDNFDFAEQCREAAKKYKWIYHCTNITAAKSIIKNREMWLTSLKYLNDSNEADRIDMKEYIHRIFVASFTCNPDISEGHWREYAGADLDNGILIGFRQTWFKQEPVFRSIIHDKNGTYGIKRPEYHIGAKRPSENKPFFSAEWHIDDFNTYKVFYEDEEEEKDEKENKKEERTIKNENGAGGSIILPSTAGIIKNKSGPNNRDKNRKRDWSEEEEIRLKVTLTYTPLWNEKEEEFPQLVIPLTDNAFDEIVVKFSPKFSQKGKEDFFAWLKSEFKESSITEMSEEQPN